MFTCVFQAGRLLLNESYFSALQNNFLPYKTWGSKPSRSNRIFSVNMAEKARKSQARFDLCLSTCVFRLGLSTWVIRRCVCTAFPYIFFGVKVYTNGSFWRLFKVKVELKWKGGTQGCLECSAG